ncbi:MAG: UDP-N-acetylmuramoyl-tripeptide--D-alanyl-D-alanine ligase [Kiritimatiellae bacterium]|jgi:UDP-N-acetylmuramoyl-tripeptide--D-alanyl-D-alanine ligase|nr:UDP-N-acetylmuramoyl-tripeptide--D-alanyl-D-alanine ligase [Kiritimatiellia bacterium]
MQNKANRNCVTFNSAQFAGWVKGRGVNLPESFCGVTQDTRNLKSGMLYVALRGDRFDGHDFIEKAFSAAAAVALVDESWNAPEEFRNWPLICVNDTRQALLDAAAAWREKCRAKIIGITGSSGKTTTKEIAAAFFSAGGVVCSTKGNFNNDIGLPLSILSMTSDCEFGVFELGTNHPGEIHLLSKVLQPDVGLVTNVGSAHIENFCSLKSIAREKGAMLKHLTGGGSAVLSMEMQYFLEVAACCDTSIITVSLLNRDADFFGEVQDVMCGRMIITARDTGAQYCLQSGLPGRYNVYNVLLAFAAACCSGVPAEAVIKKLHKIEIPGMRWQIVQKENGIRFINDAYNANPDSVKAVLDVFRELENRGRKILVLGDMLELGQFSESLHRQIGEAAAAVDPSLLCLVGPLSRRYALEGAACAGFPKEKIICFNDAGSAGVKLAELLKPDDLILLKASRGIHLEEVLNVF